MTAKKSRQIERSRRRLEKAQRDQRKERNPKCPVCGKLSYDSEGEAMIAISTGKAGRRIYLCESGKWHTTTKKKFL